MWKIKLKRINKQRVLLFLNRYYPCKRAALLTRLPIWSNIEQFRYHVCTNITAITIVLDYLFKISVSTEFISLFWVLQAWMFAMILEAFGLFAARIHSCTGRCKISWCHLPRLANLSPWWCIIIQLSLASCCDTQLEKPHYPFPVKKKKNPLTLFSY